MGFKIKAKNNWWYGQPQVAMQHWLPLFLIILYIYPTDGEICRRTEQRVAVIVSQQLVIDLWRKNIEQRRRSKIHVVCVGGGGRRTTSSQDYGLLSDSSYDGQIN